MAEAPQSTGARALDCAAAQDPRPLWLAELRRAFPGEGDPPAPDDWAGVAREPGEPARYRLVTAPRKSRAAGCLTALIGEGLRPVAVVDLRSGEAWRTSVRLGQGTPFCLHAAGPPG